MYDVKTLADLRRSLAKEMLKERRVDPITKISGNENGDGRGNGSGSGSGNGKGGSKAILLRPEIRAGGE